MLFQGREGPPEMDFWKSEKIWIKPVIHSLTLKPSPILILLTYLYSLPSYILPLYLLHSYIMSAWNTDYQIHLVLIIFFSKADSLSADKFFTFQTEVEEPWVCQRSFIKLYHWMNPASFYPRNSQNHFQIWYDLIARMYTQTSHITMLIFFIRNF